MFSESQRAQLGFEEAVLREFSYLEGEFGFRKTKQSLYGIRFESEHVFVDVFHGLKDYEIGIQFGLLRANKTFCFIMFLRRFFPEEEKRIGDSIAGTKDQISHVTKVLAEVFRDTGKSIVDGEAATYAELENVRWWHFDSLALGHQDS
jgi:hypothetical protein